MSRHDLSASEFQDRVPRKEMRNGPAVGRCSLLVKSAEACLPGTDEGARVGSFGNRSLSSLLSMCPPQRTRENLDGCCDELKIKQCPHHAKTF